MWEPQYRNYTKLVTPMDLFLFFGTYLLIFKHMTSDFLLPASIEVLGQIDGLCGLKFKLHVLFLT